MAFWDNQSLDQAFYDLREAIRTLETQSPLRSSSITEGRLRVGGSAILLIDSDGGVVIEGSLDGDGKITWTGEIDFSGLFKMKGPTEITGNVAVKSPGKITVEGSTPIVLRQASGAAVIDIGSAQLFGFTGGIGMAAGTTTFYVIPTEAGWIAGASGLKTTNAGTTVTGRLDVTGAIAGQANMSAAGSLYNPGIPTTTSAANVFVGSTGLLAKVTSAARFKIDPQPMDLQDALLDVPLKAWIDLGNAERFAAVYDQPRPFLEQQQLDYDDVNLARVPGVIAEEVEAAGGGAFVTYDAGGVIEGVVYDRLALARTEIARLRQEATDRRVSELESTVAGLETIVADLMKKLAA